MYYISLFYFYFKLTWREKKQIKWVGWWIWCLMPLSIIFQLYCGGYNVKS